MTRKGAINPYSYRAFSNNPEQMFNYTMANLMDNMYSSFMDSSTDGTFKAVCLSGIDSEDNNGGSQTPTDGSGENYISIVVRPLAPFGDILPDPTKLTDPDEIRNVIDLHSSVFVARADFVDDNQGVQYGQILNCYFETGKISTSDFSGLRFSKPVKTELSNDYIGLSTKTSEDSQIDWSNAQILGSATIDLSTGSVGDGKQKPVAPSVKWGITNNTEDAKKRRAAWLMLSPYLPPGSRLTSCYRGQEDQDRIIRNKAAKFGFRGPSNDLDAMHKFITTTPFPGQVIGRFVGRGHGGANNTAAFDLAGTDLNLIWRGVEQANAGLVGKVKFAGQNLGKGQSSILELKNNCMHVHLDLNEVKDISILNTNS